MNGTFNATLKTAISAWTLSAPGRTNALFPSPVPDGRTGVSEINPLEGMKAVGNLHRAPVGSPVAEKPKRVVDRI